MDLSAICDALGNPTRYRIIKALRDHSITSCCDRIEYSERAVSVADIMTLTGLAQATVSQHLAVLLRAGLLRKERRETWSCYFLEAAAIDSFVGALAADIGTGVGAAADASCGTGACSTSAGAASCNCG
mgnify:CR=1 FL=1